MKDLRLAASLGKDEKKANGALAHDVYKVMETTASELNLMLAKNSESSKTPSSHEEVIADLLMENYEDPILMLKRGKINVSVITAAYRHVKQENVQAGGKADYWHLDWPRFKKLSPEAKTFMDPNDVWHNGDV